jgi:hypothetical protein
MDKQRTFFYGFIVGVIFMMFPVPGFTFLGEILMILKGIIQIIGLILFVVCSVPLIIHTYRALIR